MEKTLKQDEIDALFQAARSATPEVQAPEVRRQLPKLPKDNVIAEPVGRDTCAAVTLGAALVGARSTTV